MPLNEGNNSSLDFTWHGSDQRLIWWALSLSLSLRAEESPIDFITLIGRYFIYTNFILFFSVAGGPHQLPLAVPDDAPGGDDGGQQVPPAGQLRACWPLPGPAQTGHAAQSPHQDRGEADLDIVII